MIVMTVQVLKSARLAKRWNETEAARRLGVSQAYLNYLEHGKRKLTAQFLKKAAAVYRLSPTLVPPSSAFTPRRVPRDQMFEYLAALSYPGFSYLRSKSPVTNPHEVLLTALSQETLDSGVAEALPWVALKYGEDSPWLVENARRFNLQNRLGFVVNLARKLAEQLPEKSRAKALQKLEDRLEESRLVKEDLFYRPPRTASEREWLLQNRSKEAVHWNLLTDLKPAHLQYTKLSPV
jgi:transcriptional regulator with XRE-family HTH domain